ncbi:hypothetical protein WJX72_012282 [[Myrmecia] bisecta]|uniref:Uncharacterized protein n=1 Tax=[Myrmecia] bisecta TaxID=41462 RepID=A0AAW1QTA3_9CHLO
MRALRRAQADRGRLEYYTVEHLRRLKQFTAATPYKGGKSNVYCKDVHVQPCKECQSCHFCRQKTIDPKTSCRCQFLPVRGLPGANCLRSRRNLEPTKMLISEAEKLNYKSVAHYLILTHLSSEGAAMPMEELSELRHRKRQAEQARLLEEPPHKAAKLSKADRASAAVRQKGERRIEEQMEKLFKVCSSALTQRRPPLSESGFGWGILDRDRDDEDEDDDGPGASNPFSRTHTATGVPANPPNASNQLPGGESAGGASVAGAVPQNPFLHRVTAPRAAGTAAARGRPRASGLPDAEEWHDTRFDGPHPGLDAGTCAPVRPDSHLSRQGLKQSPAARKSKGWYAKLHEKADHLSRRIWAHAAFTPEWEAEYQEPFVDFESSCIEARGTLVYAAFELLQVMSRRGMDLSPAVEGILGFLAVVAAEFERLSRPIDASAGRIGPEQLMGVAEEDEISLAALRHCDSYQLLVILQLIQRVCHTPTRGAERLLGEELMCLLDVGTLFTRDHRQEALAAIYTAVLAVSPDALERMSEDEVLEAVEHRRALAEQIRTAVLPRLEACVVMTYPDRALAEGLLDRGSPLDLALEVRERYQQTQDPGSVLPQSLYRHFGVFYVARALTAAPDVTCQTRVAVELLHMWLRALLDTGSRTVLAFFTDVLSKCSGGQVSRLFQGARSSFDGICGDRSGAVRAELAATVFGALARSEDHEYLKFIMEDLDGMLAERTFSLESRGANCAFRWHAPTARILMAVAGAATDWLAKMVVKDKGPSLGVMLRQVARWMDKAAVYLQSCYAEVLRESADSAGPAEDAAPAATLGDARQVVGQSALLCMPSMLATTAQAMRIAHQAALQIARTSQSPPPTFHKAMEANGDLVYTVRLALAPCLEVPLGGVEPSPVDRACWELLATALVPSPGTALPGGGPGGAGQASADLANAGQANAAQADAGQSPAMQELILEVLGTHVRWHLSRALVGDTGTRNAVNTLRWMAVLFSQPRLRGHEAMLKLLLPQLLSPLLQILAPGSPDSGAWAPTYRMGVRHAAYSFLTELLEVHPAVLPPRVDLDKLPRVEDSPINGALQSRNQAAALKDIRWDNARQHVFHAVAGGIVAVVASLVIDPREDMPCVAGMQPLDEKATNSALGQLTKCFGMPRSFDALTRQSAAPLPFKLAPGQQPFRPPDFKYVVAAQCFKFVGALAKVERHGKTWVGPIMASLQQLMRHNAALAKPLKPAYSQLVALLKGLGLMVQAPPAAAPAHVQTLMVQAPPAAAAPRERLWSREELAHCKRGDVVTVRGWLSQAPTEEQHNHICWLKANVDDAEGRLARIMAVKELQFVDR